MIRAEDAVVWTHWETRQVMVRTQRWGWAQERGFKGSWGDPIGANHAQWLKMNTGERIQLMLETALDLGMQGYPLKTVLMAFADVQEFRALGSESFPMCRALTKALVGRSLEFNTMSFEELLIRECPPEVRVRATT